MKKFIEDRSGQVSGTLIVVSALFFILVILVYYIYTNIAPLMLDPIISVTQTYVDAEGGNSVGWMSIMLSNLRFWPVAVAFILLAVAAYVIIGVVRRRHETFYR